MEELPYSLGIIILIIVAIVICVVLTFVRKTNVGYLAYPFAFLIGGIALSMSASDVIALFPVSLFLQIALMCIFFGYAIENGTVQLIANRVVYWFRGSPAMLPFVLFAISFGVCAVGCAPQAIGAALCAIALGVHRRTGLSYYVCVSAVSWGAITGAFTPQTGLFYTIIHNLLLANGFDELAATHINRLVFVWQIPIEFGCMLIIYFFLKCHKGGDGNGVFDKPDPMNKKQKTTAWILLFTIGAALFVPIMKTIGVPVFVTMNNYVTVVSMSTIGAALCALLRLADDREVLQKRVPWNMLFMIAGMTALITLLTNAGITNWIQDVFSSGNFPRLILPFLLCLLAGAISLFSDSAAVVLPLFIPISVAIAAVTASNPILLVLCVITGSYTTGKSPLSTGGASAIMFSPEDQRQHWFNFAFIYCLILLVLMSVVCFLIGMLPFWY